MTSIALSLMQGSLEPSVLNTRLIALESERIIRNVLARYMKLCDQPCHDQNAPQLGDLFTSDAIWEGIGVLYTQTFGRQVGRENIAAFLGTYLAPSTHFKSNVHFLTSDAITVNGEKAYGEWVMIQVSTYEDDRSEFIAARLSIDFHQQGDNWLMSHFRTQRLFCFPLKQQHIADVLNAIQPTGGTQ